jgi:hypothetical protein
MIGVVLTLLVVPVAAGLMCFALPARMAAVLTVVSGLISFALVLTVVPAAAHHDLSYLSYLRVDAVSAIFLLPTGFLYAAVAVYAVGAFLAVVTVAKRLQSGRLDAYLLYMLIALIAVIAVATALA